LIKTPFAAFGLSVLLLAGCHKNIAGPEQMAEPAKSDFPAVTDTAHVAWAGVRSSSYGINPFPSPGEWTSAMQTMSGYFTESSPCAIWIVGEIWGSRTCHLFFPSDGSAHPNISFDSQDRHEPYLDYFDLHGVKVFLQVEPANADIGTLIDLVLDRYGHHSCVIGFGVDAEWYREADHPDWGAHVPDDSAAAWETQVKTHHPAYRLFLKHWDRSWMPPTYRGDILFISDSQGFPDMPAMVDEFADYWADHFKPNPVAFQIGYAWDKPWWQYLGTPPKTLGQAIADRVEQTCGIFWVDFTLRDVLLNTSVSEDPA